MSKNFRMMGPRAAVSALMIGLVCGVAVGADVTDEQNRVAAAKAAYEKALADLQAAEAALAVAQAEEAGGGAASQAQPAAPSGDSPPPAETVASEPGFFDLKSWEKTIDIGLTGASGNSDNVNLRLQLTGERKTSKMETKATALYRYSQQDSEETESRFRFDVRNDWLPPEGSKIRWWAQGSYEYDDFQDWDHRVAAAAGIGYEIIKNDKHTLIGRLGLGGSQTFGGADEDFRPEAVAGLDYAYQIKENQKFTAGTEMFLDVSDTDNYRLNSFAAYEVLVDPDSNMLFKTGVAHRYDSEPGGTADKSDFEYFATMGWKF